MKTVTLDINDINLDSPVNERKSSESFDEEADNQLTESIRECGMLYKPIVRPAGDSYEVVAGKRRIMAAKKLGWEDIEVMYTDSDDLSAALMSFSENHFRSNVSPMDRINHMEYIWEKHKKEEGLEDNVQPSARTISELTGTKPSTIQLWLEGANRTWEGTVIENEIEGESETDYYDSLGEQKVSILRRGIEQSDREWETEEIDDLIQYAYESEISQQQTREVKELLAKGADTQTAMEAVTNGLVEETHAKLDGKIEKVTGEYTQSLEEDTESEEESEDIESIRVGEKERTEQWLDEVEDAEENVSEATPEPSEETSVPDVDSFEISFTVDDERLVNLMKVTMDELAYDDPNLVVKLALDRFLSMRENGITTE